MNAVTALELQVGALRLALRPDLGGSIAGLWHGGVPVLRSTEPAALTSPREAASFALLPYSNRLGQCRFSWRGVDYETLPNFGDSPHSLHGVGWLRAWQVEAQDTHSATLRYVHLPDAHWPFAFAAEQYFELTEDSLRLRLRLSNQDLREQPVGLGWHPYFPRRAHSHLKMTLAQRWELDALKIPTHAVSQPGLDADVADLNYDHCFAGWTDAALIEDACFRLQLSSTLRHAVVYTPPDRSFFCVEPVSHVNDAIHFDAPLAHGLVALAPGASTEAAMTLRITPA